MSSPNTDLDLMMYFDGELSEEEARAVEEALKSDELLAGKVSGLDELSQLYRGYVELSSDEVEQRLEGLWGKIAGEISNESPASEKVIRLPQRQAEERATDDLVRKASFWHSWQGNLVTSGVAAAAVALLFFFARPEKVIHKETIRQAGVISPQSGLGPAQEMPATLKAQEPMVEALEVYGGSGVIMTVEGDEEEDSSAVIWISDDDSDVMEEPI